MFRFLAGICLAGIYPLGMKLIVSWAPERVGSALALPVDANGWPPDAAIIARRLNELALRMLDIQSPVDTVAGV